MTLGSIPHETIEERIFFMRGRRVMVDRDFADLYEVETKYLNRQVKRNIERFSEEFTFKLTKEETDELVTICHRFTYGAASGRAKEADRFSSVKGFWFILLRSF